MRFKRTVPLRTHLPRYALSPSFDSVLGSVVERVTGEGAHAGQTGHVEHQPPVSSGLLPHDFHRLHRHAHSAEEVRLELLVHLVFSRGFGIAGEGITRIVDHDVEVEVLAEVCRGCGETCTDGARLRDIYGNLEDPVIVVG